MKPHALDMTAEEWQSFCIAQGEPSFTHKQIIQWIYQKNSLQPQEFRNLKRSFRALLEESFRWQLPEIVSELPSKDGSTKYLLQTQDKLLFEMVLMPYEGRTSLCISCQVGCKMGCTFCQTGKMGFTRHLSAAEILGQILLANTKGIRVSNVLFMGMGEPLDNYEEVVKAARWMIAPEGLALSPSRVTLSTSGLVKEIARLGRELPLRLAISLHSADETKRSEMMPINRRYPLSELKKVLLTYPAPARYGITFEYVMIQGKNDSLEDAKKLVRFVHGLKAKVNLIPLNHFPGVEMNASDAMRLRDFQRYLADRSIPAPIRYSRGQDVSGGCGQLAAKTKEELHLAPTLLAQRRRQAKRAE